MDVYQDLWNKTRDKLAASLAEETFDETFSNVKKVLKNRKWHNLCTYAFLIYKD